MACALASVAGLQEVMLRPLTDDEKRVAPHKLVQASDLARHHAGRTWEDGAAPAWVRGRVLEAVVRWLENPSGVRRGTSGTEMTELAFATDGIWFPDYVVAELAELRPGASSGNAARSETASRFGSGPARPAGWVPIEGGDGWLPLLTPEPPAIVALLDVNPDGSVADIHRVR